MEILSVNLHVAQNFGGFVAGTINAEKHNLKITADINGVLVEGRGCKKLVPFSNIQGVDYKTADGTVVGTGILR